MEGVPTWEATGVHSCSQQGKNCPSHHWEHHWGAPVTSDLVRDQSAHALTVAAGAISSQLLLWVPKISCLFLTQEVAGECGSDVTTYCYPRCHSPWVQLKNPRVTLLLLPWAPQPVLWPHPLWIWKEECTSWKGRRRQRVAHGEGLTGGKQVEVIPRWHCNLPPNCQTFVQAGGIKNNS